MTQAAVSPTASKKRIVHDRPPMLAIGVMIWLGSELMFFSGLFAALFTIRAHLTTWPPVGTHLDTLQAGIFTVILVASSGTMWAALYRFEYGERAKAKFWILVSIVMGAIFLYTNSYGSIFFITTGLHGIHVFIGLVAMALLLGRLRGDRAGDPGELSVFQGVSYYWHFVDVVWVGLYAALFLLK